MNAPQHIAFSVFPLGWQFSWLSKLYFGALTKKLEYLEIDRYFVVLLLLDSRAVPMCQQEMSDVLNIDKTYMVKVVDYLLKSGYINKSASGYDRRRQLISLSNKGLSILPDIHRAVKEIDEKILEELGPEELKHFQSCLTMIAGGLMGLPRNHVTINYKSSKK